VHGRRLSLPQEICSVSFRRLRMPRGNLTAGQKSAEGVLVLLSQSVAAFVEKNQIFEKTHFSA
jgi:hypothetical protein